MLTVNDCFFNCLNGDKMLRVYLRRIKALSSAENHKHNDRAQLNAAVDTTSIADLQVKLASVQVFIK